MGYSRTPGARVRNIAPLLSFLAGTLLCGTSLALPPMPHPYPVELPIDSLPEPQSRPGSVDDLPAPFPAPLTNETPRIEALDEAGARQPGDQRPYGTLAIENTPENRSRLREEAEELGLRAAWAVDTYIIIDIGVAGKYGEKAAKNVGRILSWGTAVYEIHKVRRDTGSFEQTFHQFIRESFKLAGGAWAGSAATASGVGAPYAAGAAFIGTEIGGAAAEVVIWTGVTIGDGLRTAYDYSAEEVSEWYGDFSEWWYGPGGQTSPQQQLPSPCFPKKDGTPGDGPQPQPRPTPTPNPGDTPGSGSNPGPQPNPGPTPTPDQGTGGNQPSDSGSTPTKNPGQSSSGYPQLPKVHIDRPAGWGVGK